MTDGMTAKRQTEAAPTAESPQLMARPLSAAPTRPLPVKPADGSPAMDRAEMTDTPTTPSPERQPADAGGGLLPCPFCAGEAWLNDYEAKYSDLPPKSRCPQCRLCGASLGYLTTPAKAIAAWNRRAPAPQAQPDARSIFSEDVGTRFLQERLVELAAMFNVPDGGRYLNDWKARADQINQALSAPAADDGWRPISDYDGCGPVLVSTAPESPKYLFSEPVSAFHDAGGTWRCLGSKGGMAETALRPTHFRPLPAPPVARHPAAPTDEVGKS